MSVFTTPNIPPIGSATDNALVRWDGTTGMIVQNSGSTLSDTGDLSLQNDLLLTSGAVINWDTSDVTITHGANSLAFAGASSGYSFDAQTTISVAGNGLRTVNTTDNASVQVAIFEGDRATMADGDEAYISFKLSNDAGTQTEFGRISWVGTDVNAGTSVDGRLDFAVVTAGALADEMQLDGVALSPSASDGLALGTASLMWSDLFLASAGVINFNNGNATITHSAGLLTSNVDIAVPDEAFGVGWNGSTEVPTKNAVYDQIAVVQPLDATLTALAAYNTNGILTQTAADTFVGRTITGTASEVEVSNGDGVAGNPTIGLPNDVIITTSLTLANTGLHLLDTDASHDLIIIPGSNLTSDRNFTITTGDAARTLTMTGDFTMSGAFNLTLTTTGVTNVTLPTSGTLATLAGTETLSGKTLTAPKFADLGFIADANGNEMVIFDTVAAAVNNVQIANAATGNAPVISAVGDDANVSVKFTPKGTGAFYGTREVMIIAVSDETTAITTGTAKVTFHMPYDFTLIQVKAGLTAASSAAAPAFDLNDDGVSVFSTTITIDANEKFSDTAATPSALTSNPLAIASGSLMTIDIDTAGTDAKGAKLYLIGYATA